MSDSDLDNPTAGELISFRGACDASGGVSIGDRLLAVANDEDNVIRYYDLQSPDEMPIEEDWSERLEVEGNPGKNETDIESATMLGEFGYWIGSHSRSKNAEERPDRHRFFSTKWTVGDAGPRLELVGEAYQDLLADLLADSRLDSFELAKASLLAPKSPGGLNIESLCAAAAGELLIGFRNPIPEGKALLIPLLNAAEVISAGEGARFGDAVLLNLDGLGVRDMVRWRGGYLLIGGPIGDPAAGAVESSLYFWDGSVAAPERLELSFAGLNPEGLIEVGIEAGRLLVLSDDGATNPTGVACKKLPAEDPAKRFRALWVS